MTKEEAIKEINDAADEIVRHWAIENPTVKEEAETRIEAFGMAVKMLSDEKPTDDDVNTMRILFNAIIGDLCNQCRHNDAEEMEGIRDRLIKRLLEKNKVYEWISVDERLPEDGEEVLCFLESEEMAVLFRRNNWGDVEWVDGGFATGAYDVIAWMPLPEPYKESETE